MKLISRDFRTGEKILILVLALVLLGLAYYWAVDQPVKRDVARAQAEQSALEQELMAAQAKAAQLQGMQDELDRIGSLEYSSRMGSYNNSSEELTTMNNILAAARSYTISISNVSRNGDQIRRNFTLSFTANSYLAAKEIIEALQNCPLRCVLGNITYSGGGQNIGRGATGNPDTPSNISISTTATFFETMYDGVPDAGLPGA